MIITGFSAGRKFGNTEVYIKEALMEAERLGAEVRFIRLNDFEMSNCTVCPEGCPADRDLTLCPHKDDVPFLAEQFLDADAVLIGAPVFALTPCSMLFALKDRCLGPKMEYGTNQLYDPPAYQRGRVRPKPGALISVGGATTENWVSMGLSGLATVLFPSQTQIVDFMQVTGVAEKSAATMREDYLLKARMIGKELYEAVVSGDYSFKGSNPDECCPSCHLNSILFHRATQTVECAVCGIRGHLVCKDGQVDIYWPRDDEYNNRMTVEGKMTHQKETAALRAVFAGQKAEALERLEKYRRYEQNTVKSPLREARKRQLREKMSQKGQAQEHDD